MPLDDPIEIPPGILVRCPLVHFAHRRARHCESCEHFRGLAEQIAGPATPFQHAYAVRCVFPLDRELFALSED